MALRVGQKVICVDDRFPRHIGGLPWNSPPHKGEIYTVAKIGLTHHRDPQHLPCVEIIELPNDAPLWAHRFRPIVERKTDISIFQRILENPKVPIKETAYD